MTQGTILIVDDEPLIQDLLVEMLHSSGDYEIYTALDGRQALERCESTDLDLIFTDLRMPRMNGMELLAELHRRNANIPVVILTGYGRREDVIEAMRLGAVNFLMKPHEIELVHNITSKILRVRNKKRLEKSLYEYCLEERQTYQIPNDLRFTLPLIDLLTNNIIQMGLCPSSELINIRLALDEALTNAIIHGNLEISSEEKGVRLKDIAAFNEMVKRKSQEEPYCHRSVTVNSFITRAEIRFDIEDEGHGFEWRQLPHTYDEEEVLNSHGRGLFLIRSFMDEVRFNEAGNRITLVKRKA